MYIKRIDIQNIRSIKNFHWELDKPDEELAGWHVLIGDNGSGKSTVLKAVSLALVGEFFARGLMEDWMEWINYKADTGSISMHLAHDATFDVPDQFLVDAELFQSYLEPTLKFQREEPFLALGDNRLRIAEKGKPQKGWFSAAYGPYRRFTGGESQNFHSNRAASSKLISHLSIFGEQIVLPDALHWFRELRYKQLENRIEGKILAQIQIFINQNGLLPHNVRLSEVSSEGVFFEDNNGAIIPVFQLGDGYRSILSMVFDIIRQTHIAYNTDELFSEDGTKIIMPGVILIDEVDAHLHPEWQRTIGYWLTDHFPNIQFIVTTHSPLVCQAAVRGSIWRLPAPSSEEEAHQISPDSEEWKRLVYGDILEAYSTDLFGENIDRSPEAQKLFEELGELSVKEMEEPLNPEEEQRQVEIRNQLPNVPSTELIISTLAGQGRGEDSDD